MNYSYTDNWRIKKIERVEVQTLFLHHLPELSKAQPPITIRIKFYKCRKGTNYLFQIHGQLHLIYLVLGQVPGQLVHLPLGHIAVLVLVVQLERHLSLVHLVWWRRFLRDSSENSFLLFLLLIYQLYFLDGLLGFFLSVSMARKTVLVFAQKWPNSVKFKSPDWSLSVLKKAALTSPGVQEMSFTWSY